MTVVLDASALLAYLKGEPGGDVVEAALTDSVVSSVNWSETVQKMISLGGDVNDLLEDFQEAGMTVASFAVQDGEMAARLWSKTKSSGLSLGDRAYLSLAIRLDMAVLTSAFPKERLRHRAWESLDLPVDIQLIR